MPAGSIRFVDVVGAARSTAKPSIASTSQPLVPPTRALVPIGSTSAPGKARRAASTRRESGSARAGTSDPPSASSYSDSLPITSRGAGIPRAPAMPTWRSASGRSAASASAVDAAASTGPMPQASVGAPPAPASSRSVAATTRIIAANANYGAGARSGGGVFAAGSAGTGSTGGAAAGSADAGSGRNVCRRRFGGSRVDDRVTIGRRRIGGRWLVCGGRGLDAFHRRLRVGHRFALGRGNGDLARRVSNDRCRRRVTSKRKDHGVTRRDPVREQVELFEHPRPVDTEAESASGFRGLARAGRELRNDDRGAACEARRHRDRAELRDRRTAGRKPGPGVAQPEADGRKPGDRPRS